MSSRFDWRSSRMNPNKLIIGLALACLACTPSSAPTGSERKAISEQIEKRVRDAYDLSKPDVEARLLGLYPDTGRIVSASVGRMMASRDSLRAGIDYFWRNVGVNMRQPTWVWDEILVDVLARDAAVMTATYHIPHHTPRGEPHVLAGAWTAVFQKRGGQWYVIQEHLSDLPAPPVVDSSHAAMRMPTPQ
jgi:Domain of unknown function (DUF4440)